MHIDHALSMCHAMRTCIYAVRSLFLQLRHSCSCSCSCSSILMRTYVPMPMPMHMLMPHPSCTCMCSIVEDEVMEADEVAESAEQKVSSERMTPTRNHARWRQTPCERGSACTLHIPCWVSTCCGGMSYVSCVMYHASCILFSCCAQAKDDASAAMEEAEPDENGIQLISLAQAQNTAQAQGTRMVCMLCDSVHTHVRVCGDTCMSA